MKYTVPEVVEEVMSHNMDDKVNNEVTKGSLKIYSPSPDALNKIKKYAAETGDLKVLSKTDLKLLSLAYEFSTKFDVTIITEDYAIQNVASFIGLKYKNIVTSGIKKIFSWIYYCPGCGKRFDKETKLLKCDECNTPLKRKVSETFRRGNNGCQSS